MNRSQFLRNSLLAAGAGVMSFQSVYGREKNEPQLDKKLVKEFVRVSHNNISKVTEMLNEHPHLIYASHDWRRGDFETGLGAASHVGYKKLAQLFIDRGARANLFTAALFGRIDIIKSTLNLFPNSINTVGPHGFTLLHHAEKGGDEALEVKEYLKSLGLKKTQVNVFKI